jgi:hypothetical protein
MTAKTLEARPGPRPLLEVVAQGIRNMENSIFNNYPNCPDRDDAFERLRELATALSRMTTRAELAEAEAQEKKRAQPVQDAVARVAEESL